MGFRKLTLLLVAALYTLQAFSQSFTKELTGELTQNVFVSDAELKQWYLKGYEEYHAEPKALERLSAVLDKYRFIIVIGTWCSDTQRELPRWIKVLQQAGVRESAIQIFAINEKKTVPANVIRQYKIDSVPTLIVFDAASKEIGRIVESPQRRFETDLMALINEHPANR